MLFLLLHSDIFVVTVTKYICVCKDSFIYSNFNDQMVFSGAGESGKSTIVKQMRILHVNGFSEA